MKTLYHIFALLLPFAVFAQTARGQICVTERIVSIRGNSYEGEITIENRSSATLDDDWHIFYSQLPCTVRHVSDEGIVVKTVNANYFCLSPTPAWHPLPRGAHFTFSVEVEGNISKQSFAPEGMFIIRRGQTPQDVIFRFSPLNASIVDDGSLHLYDRYGHIGHSVNNIAGVLPSVKNCRLLQGTIALRHGFTLHFPDSLIHERQTLASGLQSLGISVPGTVSFFFKTNKTLLHSGEYILSVDRHAVQLEAADAVGAFYGVETFLSLVRRSHFTRQPLPCLRMDDYPDLPYRGFMIDIARNFTPAHEIIRLIDLMASYKMNVLHLHLTDDEGWRIEIPGLPELTDVGAHRGYTTDEAAYLYPCYDGHYSAANSTTGNGFLSRKQFIDILRHAHIRHVRVVPEIEFPGHARAAVVSMEARFRHYRDTNLTEALRYRLRTDSDHYTYESAQGYHDNVMNTNLPSVKCFLDKVITELQAMYRDAGVPLSMLHIGGDEVPKGAPLRPGFYDEMMSLLASKGIRYGGWQEIAGRADSASATRYISQAGAIYCWNTVPEWGDDHVCYDLANQGYPVILSNVTNCYLDLAYNRNPQERGHVWGGTVDEVKTYDLLPYDVYRSVHETVAGNLVPWWKSVQGKTPLLKRENIKGVQAQLFAETIRGPKWVEYYVFPKILGVFERGWNAHPTWAGTRIDTVTYREGLASYYEQMGDVEMPWWQEMGVNFRLPNPGIAVVQGKVVMRCPINAAIIRYTLDGSDPTECSPRYTGALSVYGRQVKARAFYLGHESVVSCLTIR